MTPTKNAPRVRRGGSWVNRVPSWVRAAPSSHGTFEPAYRVNNIGFRTSLPVRQPRV
jgi:formylglycine-generating enzyme required for sulfatase activity